jgi:Flp pilus assembly pilin Flp
MFRYLVTWFQTTPVYRALRREDGQDLAEYALILGLIAIGLIVVLGLLTSGRLAAA